MQHDGESSAPRVSGIATGDVFERRAFHRIVASLGGEIAETVEEGRKGVSLLFPVSPRFDRREDFDVPIGCLREAAMLSGRTISLLKCRVERGALDGSCFSAGEEEFFGRCVPALSEGDALLRGRPDGTYYLVLVERDTEEIDHIADFLRAPGAAGGTITVAVERTIPGGLPGDVPSRDFAGLTTVR